jgi:multiple sugar transport system substrate-binding protein
MLRVALILCVLAALATSCGGSDDVGGSVRFLVFGDPAEINAYKTLIAEFERAEPDIDVQLVEASDREDLIAKLSTSLAGGSPPDLFLMNYRFYGQFAARGALEPLEPYIDGSNRFELADFYPQAVDAFRWDGQVTCLPQNLSSLVVYFNRDLFEKYAVPPPRTGMPWHEFVLLAQQMTRDENGSPVRGADPDQPQQQNTATPAVYGLGVEPSIIRIAPFLWSSGAELVDDDERPTRLMLDSEQAVVTLSQFFALRAQYGVVPADVDVEAEDDESRFVNGRLAMLMESRRAVPSLREAAEFDWDVVGLPVFQKPATVLHSDAYCMTKGSESKDAAWRFVEFAVGPEGAPVIARTGRTVPSLRSVAESDAFLDPQQKPKNARAFLDAVDHIRHLPTISTWPEVEDAANGILENGMYLPGQNPQDVAEAAVEATTPIFARAERPEGD